MSDLPVCEIRWPGLKTGYYSAMHTVGHGISPSVCVLVIPPQGPDFAGFGQLEWVQGNTAVKFSSCRMDKIDPEWTSEGPIWRVTILDRRWRWRYGVIHGRYNVRNPDGSVKDGSNGERNTEKTPQELAALCFDAMGEGRYDVGDLPNDTRPEVLWDGAVPAQALQALCDQFGCRIVPQAADTFAIRRAGVGADLPRMDVMEFHAGFDTAELPDQVGVQLGETLIEVHLPLEAVIGTEVLGDDPDAVKDPNKEENKGKPKKEWQPKSYRRYRSLPQLVLDRFPTECPAFRWNSHHEATGSEFGEATQKLLQQEVARVYRVKLPIDVPGWGKITNFDDLEIQDSGVGTFVDPAGVKKRAPAYVYGEFVHDYQKKTVNATEKVDPDPFKKIYCRVSFTIDAEHGVVTFGEYVFRNQGPWSSFSQVPNALNPIAVTSKSQKETVWAPARLVLVTAIKIRKADGVFSRYVRTRNLTQLPAKKKTKSQQVAKFIDMLHTDETELRGMVEYRASPFAGLPESTADWFPRPNKTKWNELQSLDPYDPNAATVRETAEYYLDAGMEKYQTKIPQVARYPGLVAIQLDGAIEQVSYSVSNQQPCMTVVARQNELMSGTLVPYKERRQLEQGRELKRTIARIELAIKRREKGKP